MPTRTVSQVIAVAGLVLAAHASSATAVGEPAPRGDLVPLSKAGVLYINMSTGERSLTLSNTATPEPIDTHSAAALFDFWMSMDENPCWDDPRADGFGWSAETSWEAGITSPIVGWDYGDLPFDSQIAGLVLKTATLKLEDTDSNADGVPDTGLDTVAAFYDGLSEAGRSSNTPPTAVIRVELIPGHQPESATADIYDVVLDFGGDWFELGDSDGQDLGDLWLPGAAPGLDVAGTAFGGFHTDIADGLADFQYLQFYTTHRTNDPAMERTAEAVYIHLGAPEGTVSFTTMVGVTTTTICTTSLGNITSTCTITITVTNTFLTPDALPQAQGAFESFGIGALGNHRDLTNIDSSIGGCCYWFGGLDCAGFLSQLDVEPPGNATWYNFSPYAQQSIGLFSNTPHENSCTAVDLNADGILDNADIGTFIALFLSQDPQADLNADGVTDNGDIIAFVSLFLACSS